MLSSDPVKRISSFDVEISSFMQALKHPYFASLNAEVRLPEH